MADYIGITEAQSNPFAPLTSELVKQLRDNPIAIAEGAAGAPPILGRALYNPTPQQMQDDGFILSVGPADSPDALTSNRGFETQIGTTSTSSTSNVLIVRYIMRAYSGNMRFRRSLSVSGGGVGWLSIWKNGTQLQENQGVNRTITLDVAIAPEDTIEWFMRVQPGNTGTASNPLIGATDIWVGATPPVIKNSEN